LSLLTFQRRSFDGETPPRNYFFTAGGFTAGTALFAAEAALVAEDVALDAMPVAADVAPDAVLFAAEAAPETAELAPEAAEFAADVAPEAIEPAESIAPVGETASGFASPPQATATAAITAKGARTRNFEIRMCEISRRRF
jgi:hypothetical protein